MGSEQLPHLNIEDNPNKQSKKKVFLIAVFSFLLLSLPVSVYLVQQQQQLASKASNEEVVPLEKSISLITPTQSIGQGQLFPVDIVIRSDNQSVNMASVKITFNPSKVKVAELLTNNAQTQNKVFFGKYWLSKGYDNDKGEITLISGAPKPGIQTKPGGQTFLLAQIRFLTISEGQADLTITPETTLFSNTDGSKLDLLKNNLTVSIQKDAALPGSGSEGGYKGSIASRFSEMQPSSAIKEQIIELSPRAGEVFFYFRPLDLKWSGEADKIKSLILYLNGEPYGVIAENLPNNGSYTWIPSLSIPLPMVIPENTYSFQIVSLTKNNQENKSTATMPFGIISDPNGKITPPDFQPKTAETLTIDSASEILSRWGEKLTQDSALDINNDWVINYLDWYLLRKNLFVKDLVF